MSLQIKDCETYFRGYVTINRYGNIDVYTYSDGSSQYSKKMTIFDPETKRVSFSGLIEGRINFPLSDVKTVFVSPKCRMSRDIIRNDYKIVRDPEKADATVLPYQKESTSMPAHIVAAHSGGDRFYVFYINHNGMYGQEFDEDLSYIKANILDRITYFLPNPKEEYEFFYNDTLTAFRVFFVKKIPELKDAILGTYPDRKYIVDNDLEVTPPTKIDVQTLEVWRRMDDMNVLAKSISMSDWKKYPFTMCHLIEDFAYGVTRVTSNDFQHILYSIGYDDYTNNNGEVLAKKIVEPDDWNLCQRWQLYRMNLPETGGFRRRDGDGRRRYTSSSVLRERVAYAPYFISYPMSLDDIYTELSR